MPENKSIGVSQAVYNALEGVRKSGLTNMFDMGGVLALLNNADAHEAYIWVYNNQRDYARGILSGFHAEKGD